MYVLTIALQKGGTGKTTTALSMASGLRKKGLRVLMMDMDPQGNLTTVTGGEWTRKSSYEVLTGKVTIPEAIQETDLGDIIPSSPALSSLADNIPKTGKESRLREALETIPGDRYDYLIIDTAPGIGLPLVNALTASDGLIITAQADIFSLQGLEQIEDTIREVQKHTNPGLRVLGVLLNRWNSRISVNAQIGELIGEKAEALGGVLYPPVRECSAIREAQAVRSDLFEYAPRSNAVADFGAVLDTLQKQTGIKPVKRPKRK